MLAFKLDEFFPERSLLPGQSWFLVTAVAIFALMSIWSLKYRNSGSRKQQPQGDAPTKTKLSKPESTFIDLSDIGPVEPNFRWEGRPQVPYRPWHDGPYHVTMGIKNLDLQHWIELDDTYMSKYLLKKRLFKEHRDEVLHYLPGCEDAIFEALELLKNFLICRFPTMFTAVDSHKIKNLVTGDVWDVARDSKTWETYHPLEVMSLLSTEDFYILQTDPETSLTTLRAGATCFPAGFKIEERIGHSLWQIHAGKVPQYESKLAKSMDRFFLNLRVGSAIHRFNYAVDLSGQLFHRHSHHNLTPETIGEEIKLEDLHLRVERQCLQRLPKTRAFLFSIRTYVTPIIEVTKDRDVARAFRTNTGSFSEDVARYKNRSLWDPILQKHFGEILDESADSTF